MECDTFLAYHITDTEKHIFLSLPQTEVLQVILHPVPPGKCLKCLVIAVLENPLYRCIMTSILSLIQ